MDKIKIGEKEYTMDELKDAVDKSSDYTEKTQKLAEQKQLVDGEMQRVKNLKELDDYLAKHPDTGQKVNQLIADDVKNRYGYNMPGNNPQQAQGQQRMSGKKSKRRPQQQQQRQQYQQGAGATNMGYSDYTPPAQDFDDYYDDEYDDDEPTYVTKDILERKMQDVEKRVESRVQQQNKKREVQSEIDRQFKQLKGMGYVDKEVNKILQYSQQKNMWPVDAAQNLAFQEAVPNRFKKKESENQNEKGIKILKGQAGSGYQLPEDEKELIQYNNDPGELLRDKYAKHLIKED